MCATFLLPSGGGGGVGCGCKAPRAYGPRVQAMALYSYYCLVKVLYNSFCTSQAELLHKSGHGLEQLLHDSFCTSQAIAWYSFCTSQAMAWNSF